jgi:hypothetical protein
MNDIVLDSSLLIRPWSLQATNLWRTTCHGV